MPSLRPRISWLPLADLSQTPACSAALRSVSRRASAMMFATASSTTERVLEYGALKTAVPAAVAVARSIWLVPMQNAPTATQVGRGVEHGARTSVLERMPSSETPSSAPIELGLVERAGPRLDLDPGRGEDLRREGMHVLEQQGLHAHNCVRSPPARRNGVHVTADGVGSLSGELRPVEWGVAPVEWGVAPVEWGVALRCGVTESQLNGYGVPTQRVRGLVDWPHDRDP